MTATNSYGQPRKRLPYRHGLFDFAVDVYDTDGDYVATFERLRDVLLKDPSLKLTNIAKAADGKIFSSYGYRWAWRGKKLTPASRFKARNVGYCKHRIYV